MNPIDDYLSTKTADFKQGILPGLSKFVRNPTMENLGAGAAQAVGGLAVMTAASAAQKALQSIRKKRQFEEMMEVNPDLHAQQAEDPMKFNAHYNSFRRLNPEFASDPVLAGTILRKMNAYPETAGSVLIESFKGRKDMGGPSYGYGGDVGGFKTNVSF